MCDSKYGDTPCSLSEDHDGCHWNPFTDDAWVDGAKPEREFARIKTTVRKLTPAKELCVGFPIAVSDVTVGTCRRTVSELRFARLHRQARKDLMVEHKAFEKLVHDAECVEIVR